MPSLRRSSDREPGYTRRRHGRGWRYLDADGDAVTDARRRERFAALAIPPAWGDVWICRSTRGHLQVTGTDEAGRRQYIYHPAWHEQRQLEKYARILRFAEGLPELRRITARHLRRRRADRDRALAAAIQLIDRTHIRVGSEQYAARYRTYGLATLRSRHIRVEGDTLTLEFTGKGSIAHRAEVTDARLARVVAEMDDLPGYEVFAYRDEDGSVADIRSGDVNAYIKEHMGEDFSAKDFRTWAGTVAAAVALDEVGPIEGDRERARAVTRVCRVAAGLLGNTPAVCRASYIDPRVIDHFLDGRTISTLVGTVGERLKAGHTAEELAVLALLRRGLAEREPPPRGKGGDMPGRDEMPATLRRSPRSAQRVWIAAHDAAVEQYGEGERAHRTAFAALKRTYERVEDWWVRKPAPGPSDPRSKGTTAQKRAGVGETYGGVYVEGNTKEQLLARARRLGVRGRSRMTKAELARAIARAQA